MNIEEFKRKLRDELHLDIKSNKNVTNRYSCEGSEYDYTMTFTDESLGVSVYEDACMVDVMLLNKLESVYTFISSFEEPKILCNQAKCLDCGETVISHSRHDYRTCKCDNLSVDGGNDYLKRNFKTKNYIEQSVISNTSFEIIRNNLYRGARGKDGDQPLKWVKLSEISNDYLDNLIQYCEDNEQCGSIHYLQYLRESNYRNVFKINIEE